MKRALALLISLALLLGLLSGCGPQEDPYIPTGDGLSGSEESEI